MDQSVPQSLRAAEGVSEPQPSVRAAFIAQREHRRRTMWTVLWTVVFAGPFFGTVQGAAVPVLAQIAQMSDRWYGLLQAAPSLALLCQIPGALYISSVSNRAQTTFLMGVIGRSIWVLIAAIPLFLPPGTPASSTFLALMIVAWIAMHMSGLAWQSWMGDLIPARVRGRYFGVRVRIVSTSNLVTSLLLALTLPSVGQPYAKWIIFSIFLVAAIIGVYEVIHYRGGYEPPRKRPPIRPADLLTPLRDRAFIPFLIFGFLIAASNGIVAPFLWRHLLGGLAIAPFKATLVLQTAPLIGNLLMAPLWGRWIDKHGTKAAFILAVVGSQMATLSWPLVTAGHWWVGLIISIVGVSFWVGVDVANTNRLFSFGSKGGAGYFAAFNATIATAGFGSTALAGEIVERLKDAEWVAGLAKLHASVGLVFNPYMVLVALCVLLRTSAVLYMSRYIPRDSPTPTIAGVRAMAGQMQQGLMGLIYLPVKRLRAAPYFRDVFPLHEVPKR